LLTVDILGAPDRPPDKEKPPVAERTAASERAARSVEDSATARVAQPRKWKRILRALVDGRSLNRFEAARELRDWVLNTTVSQLEQRGLSITRREEIVAGAFGPVHCMRYSLAPESIQRARELLGLATAP
jgi:hypothetical protein